MSQLSWIFNVLNRILNIRLRAAGFSFSILNMIIFLGVFFIIWYFLRELFR